MTEKWIYSYNHTYAQRKDHMFYLLSQLSYEHIFKSILNGCGERIHNQTQHREAEIS